MCTLLIRIEHDCDEIKIRVKEPTNKTEAYYYVLKLIFRKSNCDHDAPTRESDLILLYYHHVIFLSSQVTQLRLFPARPRNIWTSVGISRDQGWIEKVSLINNTIFFSYLSCVHVFGTVMETCTQQCLVRIMHKQDEAMRPISTFWMKILWWLYKRGVTFCSAVSAATHQDRLLDILTIIKNITKEIHHFGCCGSVVAWVCDLHAFQTVKMLSQTYRIQ